VIHRGMRIRSMREEVRWGKDGRERGCRRGREPERKYEEDVDRPGRKGIGVLEAATSASQVESPMCEQVQERAGGWKGGRRWVRRSMLCALKTKLSRNRVGLAVRDGRDGRDEGMGDGVVGEVARWAEPEVLR
jgi:hypothetical protein